MISLEVITCNEINFFVCMEFSEDVNWIIFNRNFLHGNRAGLKRVCWLLIVTCFWETYKSHLVDVTDYFYNFDLRVKTNRSGTISDIEKGLQRKRL